MYYKFSKLAKATIIINIVLTLIAGIYHSYNVYRIKVTHEIILKVMAENNVIKLTAIRLLEREGVDLFLGQEYTTYFGLFISILTIFLLFKFAKNNEFFFGFFAALFGFLTTFVGGLLLFYVILSGKSETSKRGERYIIRNEWEEFIHGKSESI